MVIKTSQFLAIIFTALALLPGGAHLMTLAAGLLIAATLAIFFVWTYPANQATGNWSSAPEDWEQLRIQWEYSHAANAVLTFIALLCSVGAALGSPDARIAETRGAHFRRPIDVA